MFDSISDKFSSIIRSISGKSKITEKNVQDAMEEIKVALLDADVNLRVVRRFVNRTMEEARGDKVLNAIMKIVGSTVNTSAAMQVGVSIVMWNF